MMSFQRSAFLVDNSTIRDKYGAVSRQIILRSSAYEIDNFQSIPLGNDLDYECK